MGNVAEVKFLRGYLKSDQFIGIFLEMLDNMSDGIEISYNTAGVLSHMLADGEHLWREQQHAACDADSPGQRPLAYTREAIGESIIAVTEKWDANSQRNINYRSFLPILSLITAFDSYASQYLAAWALNNLSLVYPDKYCALLHREGALDQLDKALADARSPEKLLHWLQLTADRIRAHLTAQSSGAGVRAAAATQQVPLADGEQMDTDD